MNEYLKDLNHADHLLNLYVIPFASHLIGAFVVWIVGGLCIRGIQRVTAAALQRRHVDATLRNYTRSTLGFILRILLILAILDIFGLQTTSLSAILAAAGVAIGVAWSGLLSNFAAGIFLIIFRPFKLGDSISAAGVSGTVRGIGLFATTLDNGDNARIFISNNKFFSENIVNFSTNAFRVVTFKVQLAQGVDPFEAIERFRIALQALTPGLKVTQNIPDTTGEVQEINTLGPLINMKVSCHQDDYAFVSTEGARIIYKTLAAAKYPPLESKTVLIQRS